MNCEFLLAGARAWAAGGLKSVPRSSLAQS